MNLNQKTLEKLRLLINEETEYRSGPQLIAFFKEFGFNDVYQNFPSRWVYTDSKLAKLNGTSNIDSVIKKVLAPINFIGRYSDLDKCIVDFNQFLIFDGWMVVRNNAQIEFKKAQDIDLDSEINKSDYKVGSEEEFLNKKFERPVIKKLGLEPFYEPVIEGRINEIEKIIEQAPLSAIFTIGSTLEGIFLGVASKIPKEVNQAASSPKNESGKVKSFHLWSLNDFINVFAELKLISKNVKNFSHEVRSFRNYIHPYQQTAEQFTPNNRSAKIAWQVLLAAVEDITTNKSSLNL
jgi:hypothetical protein